MSTETATARRILSTLASAEYLAAPPDLSMRLMSKVKDGKSSADDIAQLVMCSPPISASLLKLCNSAYYARGQSIDSVSRAVVHLGLTTVLRFVYAMMHIDTDKVDAMLLWIVSEVNEFYSSISIRHER